MFPHGIVQRVVTTTSLTCSKVLAPSAIWYRKMMLAYIHFSIKNVGDEVDTTKGATIHTPTGDEERADVRHLNS